VAPAARASGLLAVCGNRPVLGAITSLAIVAMVMMAAVSLLSVLGLAPFTAQTDSSYAGLVIISGWVFAASRAGRAPGRLPRQVDNCGAALAYPVWLTVLSCWLPGRLADHTGAVASAA
jgi:hypothetical protein